MLTRLWRDVKKWRTLPQEERRWLRRALYFIFKNQLILTFKTENLSRWVTQPQTVFGPIQADVISSAQLAIGRWTRRLRPTPSCLLQALVLRDLLSDQGQPAEIRLLSQRHDAGHLQFHAVVCINGIKIYGDDILWQGASTLRLPSEFQL